MPIKLVAGRHGSPNYYIRGSFRGIRIDKSTGVGTRKEAEEIFAAFNRDLLMESVHGSPAVRTFADAALSYMEDADGERKHVPALLRHFGDRPLSRIGPNEIHAAAKKLSKRHSGRVLMSSTVNRQIYTPLSAILHQAARQGWCPKPIIARPKQTPNRIRYLTRAEAERLIQGAAPHLRPIVTFMFSTGCRVSEALYLDWQDVDLANSRLVFWDTKNSDNRGIPLNERAVETIAAMPHRTGAVFRRPDGQPYAHRNGEGGGQLKTAWKSMLKRAQVSDFRPHDTRHTWASWTYGNGAKLNELMELGGWKSERMALRYAHTNPDHLAASAAAVWGNLRGVGSSASRESSGGGH